MTQTGQSKAGTAINFEETLSFLKDLPKQNAEAVKDFNQVTAKLNQSTETLNKGLIDTGKSLRHSKVTMAVIAGVGVLAVAGIAGAFRSPNPKRQSNSWVNRVEQEKSISTIKQR